jgi:SPP1 gp7 family putative phage head morphogenesis protein
LETAENITQTTIRLIQEVLSDAALEGWSFDEIVKRLVSPDMTAKRARLIARTETVNAANAGSMANLKAAGATKKIWIAARDNRTRTHHREVNQTVIGIDELFKVGDSYMSHPGSKEGSAAEVCNCRCAVAGVVGDDDRRAPFAALQNTETLQKVEDEIRNQNFESIAVFKNGKKIFFKNGDKSSVTMTDNEVKLFKDAIVTHNHPSSRSFSEADLVLFHNTKSKELRAISKLYDYSLSGNTSKFTYTELKKKYLEFNKSVREIFTYKMDKNELTLEQANAEHHHEVNKLFAEYFNLTYKRVKR